MSFVRLAPEQFDTIPEIPEPAENPLLVGHGDAIAQVAGAYRAGKLHHALLVAGPPGIGKATFAFHLAHHLLANPVAGEAPETFTVPDAGSALYRQIAQGAHPSVLHLTRPVNDKANGFKTVVTVEEIRKVSRFLSMTSHDGSYRIVIVDPADDMNRNAANALLKNLEEPPAKSLFILIAHSLGSLLPTIRSRCQMIRLKPLDPASLIAVLARLHAGLPQDDARRDALAERAGGSVRDALLLTEFGGLDIAEAMERVAAQRSFDAGEAWRVAEAVSGRDSAVQFGIFNQTLLDSMAAMAQAAAGSGNIEAAARLSETWREASQTVADTETYNLDKKQHVMGLLRRLHQARNA